MALVLIEGPKTEPLVLNDVKTYLRVDGTDEDIYIASLITAARLYCENYQNRAYITQTWQLWLDAWPSGSEIVIPRPPLQSVTSIKYYGKDGTGYTLNSNYYIVDAYSIPGRVVLKADCSWPETELRIVNGVCVEFIAGYGSDDEDVPMTVKQAMLLLIGHWYENREAAVTGAISRGIEFAVDALLWQDRVVPV